MYKPLEIKLELSFVDENEDQVVAKATIVHKNCTSDGTDLVQTHSYTAYCWDDAVSNVIGEMFNGGDLGDLFWPLQNEE